MTGSHSSSGKGPTVGEIVQRYLDDAAGRWGAEALEDRSHTLRTFADLFGSFAAVDCPPGLLPNWIETQNTWRSSSTKRSKEGTVIACFKWAAREGLIPHNPFVSRHYREGEARPPLEDSILDDVCSRANKPFEHALRFLRLTVCRLSALCGLTWEDVNLEQGTAILRSAGKAQEVGLVPEAIELLQQIDHAQGGLRQGHVFRNNRGRAWNRRTLGQQLRRMKDRYGLSTKGTLHGIRHQAARVAAANGAPLKAVSALLGHTTDADTKRIILAPRSEVDVIRETANLAKPRQ
jgi:integrase